MFVNVSDCICVTCLSVPSCPPPPPHRLPYPRISLRDLGQSEPLPLCSLLFLLSFTLGPSGINIPSSLSPWLWCGETRTFSLSRLPNCSVSVTNNSGFCFENHNVVYYSQLKPSFGGGGPNDNNNKNTSVNVWRQNVCLGWIKPFISEKDPTLLIPFQDTFTIGFPTFTLEMFVQPVTVVWNSLGV